MSKIPSQRQAPAAPFEQRVQPALGLVRHGGRLERIRGLRAVQIEAVHALEEAVAGALQAGESTEAVGAAMGVTRQAVRQIASRAGHGPVRDARRQLAAAVRAS